MEIRVFNNVNQDLTVMLDTLKSMWDDNVYRQLDVYTYGQDNYCYSFVIGHKIGVHGIKHVHYRFDSDCAALVGGSIDEIPEYLFRNDVNRTCPDRKVQFLAFAPNNDDFEINITLKVAKAAESSGLKTAVLLIENATRQAMLDYLSCENLVGFFYDGDADPTLIIANDVPVTYKDFATFDFNYQLTTYWLACEAFNSPMLDSMTIAKPKKWAAGINDLLIGPSDKAAAHAMIDALRKDKLTEGFDKAYDKYDKESDHWGYGGFGSNVFFNK